MVSLRQSAALFAEAKRCVEQNRMLIVESRRRVAASRRRLNPWFAVSGGSEPSERSLRATVRTLLASGLLRPIDGKALAGQGTWTRCVVCGEAITSGQLQMEPASGRAVAHAPCFLAWYGESNAVDEEGPPDELEGKGSAA